VIDATMTPLKATDDFLLLVIFFKGLIEENKRIAEQFQSYHSGKIKSILTMIPILPFWK